MNRLRHGSVCAVLAVLILSGCQQAGRSAEPEEKPDWRSETSAWSMVSTDPAEFGIVYDEWNDLDGYALDKLAAYCLGADGIYAEEGFDQMYWRFVEAPHTWVTYVSLLPEEEQKILCEHTALAAVCWYGDSDEFSGHLKDLETAYSSGAQQTVVSLLRNEYENAAAGADLGQKQE